MTNTSREQLEWRRNKVQELAVKGFRQIDIIQMLHIDKSVISRDVAYLNEQAKETIKHHMEDRLPYEYGKCLYGLEEIIKESWIISAKADKSGDSKEKLQSLALIKECYSTKMELLTNAGLLNESIRFVENTKDKLSNKVSLPENFRKRIKVKLDNGMEGSTEVNQSEQSATEPVF